MPEGRFISFSEEPPYTLAPGSTARALVGERAMLNLVEMEPGASVEPHSHPHEQLGMILRGSMTMRIGDSEREIAEFDAFVVPGGVEHGGQAGPEGALLLDTFVPVREDYRDAARDARQGPPKGHAAR